MRKTKSEIKTTVDTSTQTPIEIALQIDENGMTSLRALYEFLELSPTQFTRWTKKNILDNPFATENVDYFTLRLDVETPIKGQTKLEYKLTSDFAKQLSMTVKNERGQEARKYFIACEQGLKIATTKLQDKSQSNIEVLNTLNNITTTLSSITDRLTKLETQTIKPTLPIPKYSRWKSITFEKFKLLMNYVNDNSDQDLSLTNTMNLVFKEVQDTYNIDFADYTYMYKCEFGLPEDEKIQTLDVINHYKDLKDMFNLTLDAILEKLHIQTEKNTSWNIFDELAAKIN